MITDTYIIIPLPTVNNIDCQYTFERVSIDELPQIMGSADNRDI